MPAPSSLVVTERTQEHKITKARRKGADRVLHVHARRRRGPFPNFVSFSLRRTRVRHTPTRPRRHPERFCPSERTFSVGARRGATRARGQTAAAAPHAGAGRLAAAWEVTGRSPLLWGMRTQHLPPCARILIFHTRTGGRADGVACNRVTRPVRRPLRRVQPNWPHSITPPYRVTESERGVNLRTFSRSPRFGRVDGTPRYFYYYYFSVHDLICNHQAVTNLVRDLPCRKVIVRWVPRADDGGSTGGISRSSYPPSRLFLTTTRRRIRTNSALNTKLVSFII